MIKGEARIAFGSGDIRTTALLVGDIGTYMLENTTPHIIGSAEKIEDGFMMDGKPIVITFTKVESLNVVIDDLLAIRKAMEEQDVIIYD